MDLLPQRSAPGIHGLDVGDMQAARWLGVERRCNAQGERRTKRAEHVDRARDLSNSSAATSIQSNVCSYTVDTHTSQANLTHELCDRDPFSEWFRC